MSANPEEMTAALGVVEVERSPAARARAFYELAKPNLSALVVITSALGFFLASGTVASTDWIALIYLVLGTALTAGGACAANMALEVQHDRVMRRTRARPIPSGRVSRKEAVAFAAMLFLWGFFDLLLFCGVWPAGLSLLSAVIYAGIYTPLKRQGPVAIWVGAVTGAIPPVMGWAAVTGSLGIGGAILFSILFSWQFPHFLALGFMYREDYARAGFRFVSSEPAQVGRHVALGAMVLLVASVMPTVAGLCGPSYLAGALIAGGLFLWAGIRFARVPTPQRARAAFFASITYLPILMALMVLDRLLG